MRVFFLDINVSCKNMLLAALTHELKNAEMSQIHQKNRNEVPFYLFESYLAIGKPFPIKLNNSDLALTKTSNKYHFSKKHRFFFREIAIYKKWKVKGMIFGVEKVKTRGEARGFF